MVDVKDEEKNPRTKRNDILKVVSVFPKTKERT